MEEHTKVEIQQKAIWNDLLRLSFVALLVTLILFVFQNESVRQELFDLHRIRNDLRGENMPGGIVASAAVFLVGSGILIGIGMPRLWVSVVSGAVYGSVLGSCLALFSTMLGASIIYKLGDSLLSPYVLNRFSGKIADWTRRFQENTFWWVLYCRLFPFANASITGIFCGCCKVSFRHYLAGSMLGFIPLTIVFAVFGSAGMSGSIMQIALGFGLLALTVAVRFIMNRSKSIERLSAF